MSKKEVGSRKLSLTHTHNTHTLFFPLSLSLFYLINTPIGSTSWPIRLCFPPRLTQVNYKYGFKQCKARLPSHQQTASSIDTNSRTLLFSYWQLVSYRTTNARAGDGAGSVPEFIQKLFRYSIGFKYGCRKKKGYNTRPWMNGWQLMMDNMERLFLLDS